MNNFAIAVSSLGVAIGVCILGYHVWSMDKQVNENLYVKDLKLVQVLFRHGARNPTFLYNSDPYKDYPWQGGKGHLTNIGKTQLYNLGKKFRKKYATFLPDKYLDEDIYIVSSGIPRTLSSASVFLAGLYPPKNDQIWNNNLMWQPIPVHSVPRNLDNMIALKKPCPVVSNAYNALMKSDEINEKYKYLFSNMTFHTNQTISTVLDLEMIYSTWMIETDYDLKLPDWVQNFFPEPMRQATCDSFKVYSYNQLFKRLRGGVILSSMIQNMEMKLSNTSKPDRKMFVYSGHDLTLTALFKTLGFDECILPDYGASLVMELRAIPDTLDSEVKLLFYNNTSSDAYPLNIPNCKEPCTFGSFVEVFKDMVPNDWEKECGNTNQL